MLWLIFNNWIHSLRISLYLVFIVLLSIQSFEGRNAYSQAKQPLKQKWDLVSRKLEFARELQTFFSNQSTIQLLNEAEIKLRRARDIRRPLLSNRLINEAEILINQAIKELLREPFQKRSLKLENKINMAKERVRSSNIREANDFLDRAIENRAVAEQSFKAGEFQKGLKHFRRAELEVQKALDLINIQSQSTEDKAREEATRFNQLLAQSKAVISSNPDQGIQKNFRSAVKLSLEGDKAISDGNYQLAIDHYHQATRLLLRTKNMVEGKADGSAMQAEDEVAELDDSIDKIRQRTRLFEDDERIQFFMSHIEQLQQDAHKALEAQDYNLVLLNTQYARDLIDRIQNKLGGEQDEAYKLIYQQLKQLEVDLNNTNEQLRILSNNEEAKALLNYATTAKVRAENLLNEKKYRLAKESISIANRFVSAVDRLIKKQYPEPISAEVILEKIRFIEKDIVFYQSKATDSSRADFRVHLNHAEKMLDLSRENLNRNYFYAANECLEASKSALEKLKTIY